MEYKNKDIIDFYDGIAKDILSVTEQNRREAFFPLLIQAANLKTVVEIGVDKAQFSEVLLSQTEIEQFYGIDPWIDNFGSNHRPGFFDPNGENRMREAQQRLAQFGDRAILIKDFSVNASKDFEDGSIDFCYIDGDHSLSGIYTDIYSWIKKVRVGGIVSGHDYKDGPNSGTKDYFGEQMPFRVKTVMDDFCRQYGLKLCLFGTRVPGWWFVRNR